MLKGPEVVIFALLLGALSLYAMWQVAQPALLLALLPLPQYSAYAARQPYDVRKIIDAFRNNYDDLRILCAHRGLRFNGTAENSRDSYFRAAEAGIECIETDIHLSADGKLPMIHDHGLGRVTDVGEREGQPAYNPYTGQGFNPKIKKRNFSGGGGIQSLHLRDEQGRVREEMVPSLPDMIQSIYDNDLNVVLQLDFKDPQAVEPAYWALKNLTNRAGVPANEWCIYKLYSKWWQTPEVFEALPWVQDAFQSGIKLPHIPVYDAEYDFDQLTSLKLFSETNYTISVEVELRSIGGPIQDLLDYVRNGFTRTAGIFYAPGDFSYPNTESVSFFDTGDFSLPADLHVNNSVYVFHENRLPSLLDSTVGDGSADGHDYRSDFEWILKQGYQWIIADTPDLWHARLEKQGLRNIGRMIADGAHVVNGTEMGWYRWIRR